VKYLAANASGVSMLSHNKELQSAIVPLGARVPGLYARPLLLCSGELDSVEYLKSKDGAPSRRAHSYSTVPAEVSDLVANLLRN